MAQDGPSPGSELHAPAHPDRLRVFSLPCSRGLRSRRGRAQYQRRAVRRLPRQRLRGRQRLCLQARRALLPRPFELPVCMHRGWTRVRPARVPQNPPQVHQGGAQRLLPRVQGAQELLRVQEQDVQNTGGVQGEMLEVGYFHDWFVLMRSVCFQKASF